MLSWRTRRQTLYIIVFLIILIGPFVLYFVVQKPGANCFDGKQNQDEFGIDCGGSCAQVCEEEVADHIVQWQRIFESRPGEYYLAAFVENPNTDFIAQSFRYTFEVYDNNNELLVTRDGVSKSNPRERFIIFEPGLRLASPERVFLEISGVEWVRDELYTQPKLSIRNENLSLSSSPRLTANVLNEEDDRFDSVEVSAVVFNEESNVIAVSQTEVKNLGGGESENIFFTWPEEFKEEPQICLEPIETMLVFDRSGSMNDDGVDPPQPLSDAQDAARRFLNELSFRDFSGLVSFGTKASDPIDQILTNDREATRRAVLDIAILPEDETGATNLGEGIQKAREELDGLVTDGSHKEVLIVLTDGKANAPEDPGGEGFARNQALLSKSLGQEIYTIGLGDKVNQAFLRDIASTPEHYYFSATSEELGRIYGDIATSVCPERIYLTGIFARPINGN